MLNGFTNIAIAKDLTQDILNSLNTLAKKNVCVGVPNEEDTMHDDISNAELLYIHTNGVRDTKMIRAMQHDLDNGVPYSKAHELYVHENGSPLWQSPPRPVLEPSIDNNKEIISKQMGKAVKSSLEGNNPSVELEKAGMLGQNIARDWFTNPENKWAPNSKNTIKRKGSNRPLIDTGELRKSITYTIKDGEFK